MKIKINGRITELMSPLKNDIIYIELDKDETLIINHKGCLRKIKIVVYSLTNDLVIVRDFNLLKTKQEIKKELKQK